MTRHDDKHPISDAHARFLDDLSAAVDGDADALAAAADLLAESDEARDLLFDMKRVANRVGDAGDDFVPQPGLDARVLAAIDARGAAPVFQAVASPTVPDPLESRWAGGGLTIGIGVYRAVGGLFFAGQVNGGFPYAANA